MGRIINKIKKYSFLISLSLISVFYLFFRLSFPQTIEFGYDQPRLASTVIEFINKGSYLTLQSYSLASPWGNLSWGPALVILLSVFLKISYSPIVISQLMVVFNFLGLIVLFVLMKENFSLRAAIVSSVIYTTHPWLYIFSRMFYQPSVVPTLVMLSTYLLFKIININEKKNKKYDIYFILLFILWGVLIQSYLISSVFILLSLVSLFIEKRKKVLKFKYLAYLIIPNLIFFIPSIYFYSKNVNYLYKFFEAKTKFQIDFVSVFISYVKTLSGLNFEYQLGYSYADFIKTNPLMFFSGILFISVFIICLKLFISSKIKFSKKVFLLSQIVVLPFFLWFVGLEEAVPRYFLLVLPALTIIAGTAIDYLTNKYIKRTFVALLLIISISWIITIFKYNDFITNYSYKSGFLSYYSDVPYSFLEKSFKWIEKDAKLKGYDSFTVSSDTNFPEENRLNWAQSYYWNFILNNPESGSNTGRYLMYFSPVNEELTKTYIQYGPYVVSEFKK